MLETKLASLPPNHIDDQWNKWKGALEKTAQVVLGHKRRHREERKTDDMWTLIGEKRP